MLREKLGVKVSRAQVSDYRAHRRLLPNPVLAHGLAQAQAQRVEARHGVRRSTTEIDAQGRPPIGVLPVEAADALGRFGRGLAVGLVLEIEELGRIEPDAASIRHGLPANAVGHGFALHPAGVPKLLDGQFPSGGLAVLGAVAGRVHAGHVGAQALIDQDSPVGFDG